MRRIITTQSSDTSVASIEDLKDIEFMSQFLNQQPEQTVSTEGMFDFFKEMFRTRISGHVNPYEINYNDRDLDRVRTVLRKTVLDPKWLASSKISVAKFPYAKYFQMLSVSTKPFDFNDPVGYISGALKNQKHAFAKWNEFMEGRLGNIIELHGKLQSEWPELEQGAKRGKMLETVKLMLAQYPNAKEYNDIVSPSVTLGGPSAILPGKYFPSHTETPFKIESLPALTIDQLPEVANYVLTLLDTLAETDTSYQDLVRISSKLMSHLPKSDQVLSWSYAKDREVFQLYAPIVYYETHFNWVPSHIWEFVILRILLTWIMHSVGEKI